MLDLLVRNGTIVNGGQQPFAGSVGVRGEKITAILEPEPDVEARQVIDASGQVVMPGVIDPHVHYHYAFGYRDASNDYETESRSALVGGVTTAIRMHREQGPYAAHLPQEIETLESQSRIDVAFHLAVMTEEQLETFPAFGESHGITSFKLYLAYKGKAGELQGLIGADDGFLFEAMRRIGGTPGGVACVHAENSEIATRLAANLQSQNRNDLRAWTEARPGWTEGEAVMRAGIIAHHAGASLYVVHLSSKEGVEAIRRLREQGASVYAEVCIHHLTATVDSEPGLMAKVNPPLRSEEDVAALWDAVTEGLIDTIGTDHVAHTHAKLRPSLWDVMPGFAGSATMLPALLTDGYHQGRVSLSEVVSLLSANASRIFHLPGKGQIAVGADADIVLVDLEKERTVRAEALLSASDYSLYEGRTLKGWPTRVFLRGQQVMDGENVTAPPGTGRFVRRGAA